MEDYLSVCAYPSRSCISPFFCASQHTCTLDMQVGHDYKFLSFGAGPGTSFGLSHSLVAEAGDSLGDLLLRVPGAPHGDFWSSLGNVMRPYSLSLLEHTLVSSSCILRFLVWLLMKFSPPFPFLPSPSFLPFSPNRHEMPTSRNDPLANQNIKDRFYGQDDPVAQKMLGRVAAKDAEDLAPLIPPSDPSIMTLMVGGMEGGSITEMELRDAFYAFGELASVRLIHAKFIAFVEYTTREAAEAAAKALHNNLTLQGLRLRVTWATRPAGGALANSSTSSGSFAIYGGGGGGGSVSAAAAAGGGAGGGDGSMPSPPSTFPPLPPPQYMPALPPSNWTPGTIPPPPPGGPPPMRHPPQQYMQQGGALSLPPPQQVDLKYR